MDESKYNFQIKKIASLMTGDKLSLVEPDDVIGLWKGVSIEDLFTIPLK